MADCSGYRIAVDASEIVDVRNKFFIYVNLSHDKKISDIENRICEILYLKEPISLMIDDCYLPSAENVRLVHTGDVLKIVTRHGQNDERTCLEVPSSEDDYQKQKAKHKEEKRMKKERIAESECDNVNTNGIAAEEESSAIVTRHEQNDERTCLELPSSEDDYRKQKARHKEEKRKKKERIAESECDIVNTNGIAAEEESSAPDAMEVDGLRAVDETDNCRVEMKEKRKRDEEEETDVAEKVQKVEVADTLVRRRRTRRRRRPDRNKKGEVPPAVARPRPVWQQVKPKPTAARVHIRYHSEDDEAPAPPEAVVVSAEVHKPPSDTSETEPPSDSVAASRWDQRAEDPFAKLLSIASPQVYKRAGRPAPQPENNSRTTVDFTKYPLIKDCPKPGDIIAFKMLKMSQDYTPQVSDYILAQVSSVHDDTSQMELQIMDGQDQCFTPKGKFCLEEEEEENTVADDTLHLNWNELMETRLVHP